MYNKISTHPSITDTGLLDLFKKIKKISGNPSDADITRTYENTKELYNCIIEVA